MTQLRFQPGAPGIIPGTSQVSRVLPEDEISSSGLEKRETPAEKKYVKRVSIVDIQKMKKEEHLSEKEIRESFIRYKDAPSKTNLNFPNKVAVKARTLSSCDRALLFQTHIQKLDAGDKARLFFIRHLAILMYSRPELFGELTTGKLCSMAGIPFGGECPEGKNKKREEAILKINEGRNLYFKKTDKHFFS